MDLLQINNNRPRLNFKLPLLLAVVVILGMFVGARFQSTYNTTGNTTPEQKIQEVLRLIDRDYVDKSDKSQLVEIAITEMLEELDPHSTYIPITDVRAATEDLEGAFEGVGIEFNILRDTIMVVSPISGGPSDQAGIRPGDRIIKIDGKTVAGVGFKNEDVIKHLRGRKGTTVNVSMQRRGNPDLIDFKITRDKIPIYSVEATYMAAPEVGYIKINRFAATTLQEYDEAFQRLKSQGMRHMILDLRGNPGGYLQAAVHLADHFLDRNQTIVYTEGRKREKRLYNSSASGNFKQGKLVILIDEGSASASEIVSGAVQDYDRGLIVGRRSFGKGLVQEPFQLSDGSVIRLTVARYYTPSGRSIQRPYTHNTEDYYKELAQRYNRGELYTRDSIRLADSLKFHTKNGRVVFGGGGIMPDIFVGLDTSDNTPYLQSVFGKGIIIDFINDYGDRNRQSLMRQYPDVNAFIQKFPVERLRDEFVQYAEQKGVPRAKEQEMQVSYRYLDTYLDALLARQLYRSSAYFQVLNDGNDAYKAALSAIQGTAFEDNKIKY